MLRELGASGAVLDELAAYCRNPHAGAMPAELQLPLLDEPQLQDWEDYARDAQSMGAIAALRSRLVQLQFPVEAGISQRDDYRAATRRGEWPTTNAGLGGPALVHPEGIQLVLHPTAGGRVPVLTIEARDDFETLVQVFSSRNEPEAVPASMGACIVNGLNNWDRVGRHRRRFEAEHGAADAAEWAEEFKRLIPRKELYQDRFLLLSSGPYSAVSASDAGLEASDWLKQSLAIRRDHECFHFLTRRVLGAMRNNLLDELLADFVGLVRTFGRYDAALAQRFLGVEDPQRFRPGGRLGNYRGDPPLSEDAFVILCGLARRAVARLAVKAQQRGEGLADPAALARFALECYATPLEELAA